MDCQLFKGEEIKFSSEVAQKLQDQCKDLKLARRRRHLAAAQNIFAQQILEELEQERAKFRTNTSFQQHLVENLDELKTLLDRKVLSIPFRNQVFKRFVRKLFLFYRNVEARDKDSEKIAQLETKYMRLQTLAIETMASSMQLEAEAFARIAADLEVTEADTVILGEDDRTAADFDE